MANILTNTIVFFAELTEENLKKNIYFVRHFVRHLWIWKYCYVQILFFLLSKEEKLFPSNCIGFARNWNFQVDDFCTIQHCVTYKRAMSVRELSRLSGNN